MNTLSTPVIQQLPRLVIAQFMPESAPDLASDDYTARVQTNMRSIRAVQVAMVCTGEGDGAGNTARMRVGLCLHPSLDEITEAARYRGLTSGISATAPEGGASYAWLTQGGANDLWPPVNGAADEYGQSQNGGLFEAEFATLVGGSPLRARFVNWDWRAGNLGTGFRLARLTLFIHTAD